VDWNKTNWFAFLPPLFAIYLVLISSLFKGYLTKQVKHAADRDTKEGIRTHETFIRNVALGWAAQLGFVNAVIASFFSAISIWSASKNSAGTAVTLIVLLAIFTPMLWFVFTHEPDQLVSNTNRWPRTKPNTILKIVLVAVNVVLIFAIGWSQQVGAAVQNQGPTNQSSPQVP
jgi:hypothetical protein